jgi:hypothetical protein
MPQRSRAEIAGRYLGKRQLVAVEGRLQTRSWDVSLLLRPGRRDPASGRPASTGRRGPYGVA